MYCILWGSFGAQKPPYVNEHLFPGPGQASTGYFSVANLRRPGFVDQGHGRNRILAVPSSIVHSILLPSPFCPLLPTHHTALPPMGLVDRWLAHGPCHLPLAVAVWHLCDSRKTGCHDYYSITHDQYGSSVFPSTVYLNINWWETNNWGWPLCAQLHEFLRIIQQGYSQVLMYK